MSVRYDWRTGTICFTTNATRPGVAFGRDAAHIASTTDKLVKQGRLRMDAASITGGYRRDREHQQAKTCCDENEAVSEHRNTAKLGVPA
jgi:hypothetical protein